MAGERYVCSHDRRERTSVALRSLGYPTPGSLVQTFLNLAKGLVQRVTGKLISSRFLVGGILQATDDAGAKSAFSPRKPGI